MKILNRLYLPLVIYYCIIFNSILKNFGFKTIYLLFIILGILLLVFDKNKFKKNNTLVIYIFIFVLTIIMSIQIFNYANVDIIFKGYVVYSIILFYWLMYFHKYSLVDFNRVFFVSIPIVYVVAILGIIQFFFSPTLFGLLSTNDSLSIAWASNAAFTEYVSYFRASSVLGSPQVYGLFIVFYIILLTSVKYFKSSFLNIFSIFILIFAGALSGNKSFILILLLFAIYKFFFNIKKKKVFVYLIVSFIVLIFSYNKLLETRQVGRILDINQILEQEKNDSRIVRYLEVIYDTNLYIGNGLGTKIFTKGTNEKATESYFLQILAEGGIILFLSFIILLCLSFLLINDNFYRDSRFLLFAIFLSMIVVHAFTSSVFFIFWGLIISSFANYRTKGEKIEYSY